MSQTVVEFFLREKNTHKRLQIRRPNLHQSNTAFRETIQQEVKLREKLIYCTQ